MAEITQRNPVLSPTQRGRKVSLPALPLVFVLLAFLALAALAVAEMRWIPEGMPREHVARTILIATVRSSNDEPSWLNQAQTQFDNPAFLRSVLSAGVDPLDGLDPGELERMASVHTQCIDLETAHGKQRALLLIATFRGPDQTQLDAIASTWREQVTAAMAAQTPEAVVVSDGLQQPYRLCTEEP
ncbi:MAG TPA: hypothetical protein VNP04_01045 [Alphaproteobacteria bacterium]|nr:hypothetical protein [Alphaproteobacteria bacterium]